MSRMKLILNVVNDLRSLADSIETLAGSIERNDGKEKTANKKPTVKEITLEEVRAKLAALSQDGKQAQVKALITEFGAKKLSDIPSCKYPELLEKAEVL